MTSLYEQLFDDIPLFVVPGTENSDVIEYETNMQRNARLLNEARIRQQMDEIERLRMQLRHVKRDDPLATTHEGKRQGLRPFFHD